ncbi:hypothetical protein JOC75_002949 [Metabacillus crassostreae]|uniref:hypothetical protein n=1 Tax=Metabacillus crassostreae TaxID=929098 RepID=UPI00195CB26F|nr:hypothetical protein [Metabacillus crassostreae]MBM7604945.1 hypothetical protein [Metabacillus crassostreae]
MSKKKISLLLFIAGLLAVSTYVMYILMVAKDFYTEEELVEQLPLITPKKEIQDIIQLDEKTYFVPFLSDDGSYGTSIWVWSFGKWECVGTNSGSGPTILANNGNSYIYWNIHPHDQVREWEIYLTSERNYSVTNANSENRVEVYFPKVQVKDTIKLENESFGYAELSPKWKDIIGSFDFNPTQSGLLPSSHYYIFQYQAYNDQQKAIDLEHTFRKGGGGTYTGDYIHHMQQVMLNDLE